jgi:hypothetical protein
MHCETGPKEYEGLKMECKDNVKEQSEVFWRHRRLIPCRYETQDVSTYLCLFNTLQCV